jgi:hypothetical protein
MRGRLSVLLAAALTMPLPRVAGAEELATEALLLRARRAVERLGVYHATLTKTERVRGALIGPEVADTWIRERPRAVRMTFLIDGRPARRLLYNETVRSQEMLVREKGVLGLMSVWVGIDGWLVHRTTSHTVREVGFGALLDLVERDLVRGRAQGGHQRSDEPAGQGPGGTSCVVFTAPPGARDLYAARSRLCFDEALGLPLVIEVSDRAGFRERFEWRNVRSQQSPEPRFFLPEALED